MRVLSIILSSLILFNGDSVCKNFSSGSHVCERECRPEDPPKECYYHWTLRASLIRSDGVQPRPVLSINNLTPGPKLVVCQNDTVVVDVLNLLPGLETSIHWRGVTQRDSPHMDGAPMITQCPIQPRTTFRYIFTPQAHGTYLYHAYSATQHTDGLHGLLVVGTLKYHPPRVAMVISPRVRELTSLHTDLGNVWGVAGIVVSKEEIPGSPEDGRLTLINAAAIDCPVVVHAGGNQLTLLQVDGADVKPLQAPYLLIQPGERMEVATKTAVKGETVEMQVTGYNLCKNHGFGLDKGLESFNKDISAPQQLRTMFRQLKNTRDHGMLPEAQMKIYIPLEWTDFQNVENHADFRYRMGENSAFTPTYITRTGREAGLKLAAQVKGKSFLYPPSPVLSQPEDVPPDMVCTLEAQSWDCDLNINGFCECLQVVDLPFNSTIDLVLVNQGRNSEASHTVHIHGHSFHVLTMDAFSGPLTADSVQARDDAGKIKRNLLNPILKDTVVVPNKGFVLLRIITNNPGTWMVRSTTSQTYPAGMGWEFLLRVPAPQPWSPPSNFPVCGTFKKPDQIFS